MSSDRTGTSRKAAVSRRIMRGFRPDALAELRRQRGLSQGELARLAGVAPGTVNRWESGLATPQVDLLARVANILEIQIEEVVQIPRDERYPGDWRVIRGMTQPVAASKAGIATQVLGSMERGEISLSDNVAERVSRVLGISVEELREAYLRVRNRPAGTSA